VLGEFFASRVDGVDDALIEEGPYGRFPTIEAKIVSSVSIATLGEILNTGTHDELFERIEGPQAAARVYSRTGCRCGAMGDHRRDG
jgi:hypothetical protein